jgi:hypothetical protein
MDLTDIARRANEASRQSRRRGAPVLRASSSYETLRAWLAWNDPNGIWTSEREFSEAGISQDDLWAAIEFQLDD